MPRTLNLQFSPCGEGGCAPNITSNSAGSPIGAPFAMASSACLSLAAGIPGGCRFLLHDSAEAPLNSSGRESLPKRVDLFSAALSAPVHALDGGDLLGDGYGVAHACSPALRRFRSGVPASGTLSLDPAASARPSGAESCRCSSNRACAATVLAIPLAMIAASSCGRWRAAMLAAREVLGRVGPPRPCIGMRFRLRCHWAGGIPLHLRQGQFRRTPLMDYPEWELRWLGVEDSHIRDTIPRRKHRPRIRIDRIFQPPPWPAHAVASERMRSQALRAEARRRSIHEPMDSDRQTQW